MTEIEQEERIESEERIDSLKLIEDLEQEDEEERQRILKRRQRIEEMKRQKRKTEIMHRCVLGTAAAVLTVMCVGCCALIRFRLVEKSRLSEEKVQQAQSDQENPKEGNQTIANEAVAGIGKIFRSGDFSQLQDFIESMAAQMNGGKKPSTDESDTLEGEEGNNQPEDPQPEVFEAFSTSVTAGFWEDIVSKYGVLIDVESQTILAGKDYKTRINPASMTKILTVLTAAEILGITEGTEEVLDDTFTMTIEITDYSYVNDCSIAGFSVDEEVSVRDLFYGTVLPSGADAAVGLADYVAGSHEAFMELMNGKLEKMGLSDSTHFVNCVGLYDEDHYSTVYDIAVILKEAADNPFLRQVLSTHIYTTAPTEEHPEGIRMSNLFLRRIEDKDTHGEVLCGKTGYVNQAGSCAASLSVDINGREYLCVTAGSRDSWQCIKDQQMLYERYLPAE